MSLTLLAQPQGALDAREIVRRAVGLDQVNWQRLNDYTWTARSNERRFDGAGRVRSEHGSAWETVVLDGEPCRRNLERDGKPLPPAEQRQEREKLDRLAARLARESPDDRRRRLAAAAERRRRAREFFQEIPDAYDLRIEGDAQVQGHAAWVIAGAPKPGYHPRNRDARDLLKIRGRLWVDKATYQWVRLEAESSQTITFGLVLARLAPGATLVFEQSPVNTGLWLPARLYMKGAGRLALFKKLVMDEEITWSNYRKFQVSSRILPSQP